jgi:hypothetical protein
MSDKKPIFFDVLSYDQLIVFDGVAKKSVTAIDFDAFKRINKAECIFVPFDTRDFDKNGKKRTIEEQYKEFIKNADILKRETNGKINFYQTGTFRRTALHLFFDMVPDIRPEKINEDEGEWLIGATMGALLGAVCYQGEGHLYDVRASYGSGLRHCKNYFPINRGQFMKIDQLSHPLLFGIYRCEIEERANMKMQFKYNKKNFYTCRDIRNAKYLGLNVKLIKDDKPNLLYYSDEKLINGARYFKSFIDYIYDLERRGLPWMKRLRTVFWGALSQKNVVTMISSISQPLELLENRKILSTVPLDSDPDKTVFRFLAGESYFKFKHARIKPFILAYQRTYISYIMRPHITNIVRVHTDGFISKVPLNVKLGSEIGNLRYDGFYPYVEVKNCRKPVGMKVKCTLPPVIITELDRQLICPLRL